MHGTIINVVNAGPFWLLAVDTGDGIVDQPIEPRQMRDIVEAEGLASAGELIRRDIELADDGMSLGLP